MLPLLLRVKRDRYLYPTLTLPPARFRYFYPYFYTLPGVKKVITLLCRALVPPTSSAILIKNAATTLFVCGTGEKFR